MPEVSVVIITLNSEKFIKSCLDSVRVQDYRNFEIIVVDNNSEDKTKDLIQENYQEVIMIQNKENLGACQARNQGIEFARGQWILTLDCDVILEKDFLSKTVSLIKESQNSLGMFQPKIFNMDRKTIYSCGIYLSWLKKFYDIGKGRLDNGQFNTPKYIFGACSAAALYNRQMLQELKEDTGYFDERFFFLAEDVDLALRAQRRGWKAQYNPRAVCYHYGDSSGTPKKLRQYFCWRNRKLLLKKCQLNRFKLVIIYLCYDLPRLASLFLNNLYVRNEILNRKNNNLAGRGRKQKLFIILLFLVIILTGTYFLYQANAQTHPNIILITVDCLRPDHLGCYGYKINTSPNIDRLSREGVRFTQAITAAGWTAESLPSILTGTYSLVHQIYSWNDSMNPVIKTLAAVLTASKDYNCIFWSNYAPLKNLDIKDGFQRVYIHNIDIGKKFLTDYVLTSQIINRLETQYRNRPFFFYIHYKGCHVPYSIPLKYKYRYKHLYDKSKEKPALVSISSSYGEAMYNGYGQIPHAVAEKNITDPDYYILQYDGAVSYIDSQIGRLMGSLEKMGLDKNTLIILTADHGEGFGEHNFYFTHVGGYEENIKVPLIIRCPGLFPRGEVFSGQVNSIDIAPTVLGATGLKKPFYMQGGNLLEIIKSQEPYHVKPTFSSYGYKSLGKCLVLRTPAWKLIYNIKQYTWELYNLENDPGEQHNLVFRRLDKFIELKDLMENFKKNAVSSTSIKQRRPLTEEDKELLRSLGYTQ